MAEGKQAQGHWWSIQPPRTDTAPLSAQRAYLEVLGVWAAFFAASVAAAGFSLHDANFDETINSWSDAIPGSIDQLATTGLCIALPVLLARQRGLGWADLGLGRRTVTWSQGIRMAAWAVLALIVGGLVTNALATGSYDDNIRQTYPDLTLNLFHGAQAGFIEEIVVLAFVVSTLEQARRSSIEIIAVALVLRASYHIYYGPGVLGILIWAVVFLWLYRRFRSIVPLIVVHSCWDVLVFLAQRWTGVGVLLVLAMVALLITAFVLWIVDRGHRFNQAVVRPLGPPPGWYPDPAGTYAVRWFDGWRWTPYLHRLGGAPPRPVAAGPILGDGGRQEVTTSPPTGEG